MEDVVTRVAPLGLRFADPVTGERVGDGLRVVATAPDGARLPAVASRTGTWVVHHVPGLEALEAGRGDDAYWAATLPSTALDVEVDDASGRFLPCRFTTTVPRRGAFGDPCGSGARAVELFPAPTRGVAPGLAAVRAQLEDVDAGRAASWAVLVVRSGTALLGRAMADRDGRVLALFAYPATAPSVTPAPPLHAQTWPLTLELRYRRVPEPPRRPSLCDALAQPAARLLARAAPEQPFVAPPLQAGRELVLRSTNSSALLCRPNP